MGNFYPMTPAQFAARDVFVNELPMLDEEFDEGIDFSDTHLVSLEVSNQFSTHIL